jgi:hypothetical protein
MQGPCYLTPKPASLSSAMGLERRRTLGVLSEAVQKRFSRLVALMEIKDLVIVGLLAWEAGASSLTQSSHFVDCHPAQSRILQQMSAMPA